jgi:lipoate---protein ligase
MLLINLPGTDPFFNLAVDEYLLKKRKEEFLVLGTNAPSVIIGKHQVAHKETDTRFVTERRIPVLRRISGGGTVYHDEGNLNFSFILQSTHGRQVDFRKYTQPVISFLASTGITASFEGKNDLKVNGLKISGNAEHIHHERVLHHGTLLFDSDLNNLKGSLRNDNSCYITRGVESNPSSVMNLKNLFPEAKGINDFRNEMFSYFLDQQDNKQTFLSEDEISAIEKIADSRYHRWEWNYAYGPEYQLEKNIILAGNPFKFRLHIKDGLLIECDLEESPELKETARDMIGLRHMPDDLQKFFIRHNLANLEADIYSFF